MTRSVWRKRRTFKWIGLLLSLMMLGLWVFSVLFVSDSAGSQWSIQLVFGQILFVDAPHESMGWSCTPIYSHLKALAAQRPWTEFAHHNLGFGLPGKEQIGMYHIPVWLLVVAVGLPTAVLWWRDRRPMAGFCKFCKYDLTGNVSGTCPECGTAVE